MPDCPFFPGCDSGGRVGFFLESCVREVIEVQGEVWWLPPCSVFVGEGGEEVCVYWEFPNLGGMCLKPMPPIWCVIVGGG